MEIINVIMTIFLIASVNSYVLNNNDEGQIIDMLLSDNYINSESKERKEVTKDREHTPVFVNGVWLCGNCSDISEIKLIYIESYDVATTYDEEIALQTSFSLDKIRCIKIAADKDAEVEIVSGSCAGDEVTFKIMNTTNCDFWIYSNM